MKRRVIAALAITLMLLATLSLPAVAVNTQTVTASVTVTEYVNITLSDAGASGIQFGSVSPSDTVTYGDAAQSSGTPAIKVVVEPDTNVNVDISIKGSTTGTLGLINWKYSKLFNQSDIASLTGSYVMVYDNVGDGSYDFYHWISVPISTTANNYSATINYQALPN